MMLKITQRTVHKSRGFKFTVGYVGRDESMVRDLAEQSVNMVATATLVKRKEN
jgi:ATP-dependent protease HslVU (ClpYQ) ATPase subunit